MKTTINEQNICQIPTLIQLAHLGWEIRPHSKKLDTPYMDDVLYTSLKTLNPSLDHSLYQKIVKKLMERDGSGLIETNQRIYNALKNGITVDYHIDGKTKNETFKLIDWENIHNNTMFIVPEYRYKDVRFDMAIFVNGMPLAVIECKKNNLENGIAQIDRYHEDAEDFFYFNQLNFAMTGTFAQYGTTGTPEAFYSVWHETQTKPEYFTWQTLDEEVIDSIFNAPFSSSKDLSILTKITTKTDTYDLIQAMLSKERFLDLIYNYIVFDKKVKKVARYQQFLLVQNALQNIQKDHKKGLIWQTQGSGKSLLMIFLANNIHSKIDRNAIIILATDRVDLDDQISSTLTNCGINYAQANSGQKLQKLIQQRTPIIATVLHKFNTADLQAQYTNEKYFIFVDEAHRSTGGGLFSRVEHLFPEGVFFGFTGTPIYKANKQSTFQRFGELLQPTYTIRDALNDEAIVPLMYEARFLDKKFNNQDLDNLYVNLDNEDIDITNKYRLLSGIKKFDEVIARYALDIKEHYRKNFPPIHGKVYAKAQLTVDSRIEALKYHQALQKLGMHSQLVITTTKDDIGELKEFHQNNNITAKTIKDIFNKQDDQIEILIVVDKLITGFDAPINTILYINRRLKDHTLLQAIARVNRKYEGKSHGFIVDYLGLLGELKSTFTKYDRLSGFDIEDIEDIIFSTEETQDQLNKCQQKIENLLSIHQFNIHDDFSETPTSVFFKENEAERNKFYSLVNEFANLLKACKTSKEFYQNPPKIIENYDDFLQKIHQLKKNIKIASNQTPKNSQDNISILTLLSDQLELGEIKSINQPFDITKFNNKDDKTTTTEQAPNTIIQMGMAQATKDYLEDNKDNNPILFNELLEKINQILEDVKQEQYDSLFEVENIIQKAKSSFANTTRYRENLQAFLIQEFSDLSNQQLESTIQDIEQYINDEIENKKHDIGIWNKHKKKCKIGIAVIIETHIKNSDDGRAEDIAERLLKIIIAQF